VLRRGHFHRQNGFERLKNACILNAGRYNIAFPGTTKTGKYEIRKEPYMGRGDKRTEKGKRTRGSFGKSRDRDALKARAKAAKAAPAKNKEQEAPKEAPAETPTA